MYIDINGKRGYRMLEGNTKTYGNAKLLTPEEKTEMLADGITEYVEPVVEITTTLDEVKATAKATINGIRNRILETATVELDGVTYDANPQSIVNINGTVGAIGAGIPVPNPMGWRDASNTTQSLPHAKIIELAGLMFTRVEDIYQTSWSLKDAIDAATDEDGVNAVTWPDFEPF